MNTIIERITEAIKEILIGMIQNGLEGMFVEVNDKVGTIASQVGQTPQGWNAGVFNLIQNLSQTVIVPIAGLIITFVLCYELITMVTQKNNFHEFETYNIFLWIFKAYVAIYLVTNTFNITMAVFDVGQHIVNGAAGVISGSTAVDASAAIATLTESLESYEKSLIETVLKNSRSLRDAGAKLGVNASTISRKIKRCVSNCIWPAHSFRKTTIPISGWAFF